MREREREKWHTRALMSLPFLPRSLVTTTLGLEFGVEDEDDEEAASNLRVERKILRRCSCGQDEEEVEGGERERVEREM